ncbi:hypothetical protein D6764_00715 [Candidatus Woesearchaeota archaeon]|nr:MAG: hypothetical protein D6764_00715 [Candidatus Woesearchaeota archaeon]
MEVLTNVSLDVPKMKRIVESVGACIAWGGALNLAPADDKFIRVEHPLNIDAEAQLLASIIAKKKSVSSTHVLIDIPVGRGSKVHTVAQAKRLKRKFQRLGKELGMKVKAVVTDGSQPIGNGIGPALEARDVLYVLRNDYRQPFDLRDKALMLAGLLLEMAGRARRGKGRQVAEQLLNSGKAYDKMVQIIRAQGGKEKSPDDIPIGKYRADVKARRKGTITHISNITISRTARRAGAPMDKGAGIYLYKHAGERVEKGDIIMSIYSNNAERLKYAVEFLNSQHGVFIDRKPSA